MEKLRVLMLGWEDQPILNGGVGKACFHLAEELASQTDLTLIVPQAEDKSVTQQAEVLGLGAMDLSTIIQAPAPKTVERFGKTFKVPANLSPYEDTTSTYLSDEDLAPEESTTSEAEGFNQAVTQTTSPEASSRPKVAIAAGAKGTLNFEVIQFSRFAARLASHKDFQVVYAHDWMTYLAGVEIKVQKRVPLVLHVHSLSFDRQGPKSRGWVYELEMRAFHEADLILAVSERTAKMIVKRYGVDPKKVKTVYNGCSDTPPMAPAKKMVKQVVFLGRMVPQKGPLQFLKIAELVKKKDPEVRFVMAGHGPQLEAAKQMAQTLGIEDSVTFTGFLPSKEAMLLLNESGVFCLPAISEPFGLAALEATQAGLPVVLSNQTGAGEVLPQALQADAADTEGMAKHILALLESAELSQEVVEDNQKAVHDLTWENTAYHVYDALVHVANTQYAL